MDGAIDNKVTHQLCFGSHVSWCLGRVFYLHCAVAAPTAKLNDTRTHSPDGC